MATLCKLRLEFFYYLIYRNFFSDLGSEGIKKTNSVNDQSNIKTSMVNQQSVLNL